MGEKLRLVGDEFAEVDYLRALCRLFVIKTSKSKWVLAKRFQLHKFNKLFVCVREISCPFDLWFVFVLWKQKTRAWDSHKQIKLHNLKMHSTSVFVSGKTWSWTADVPCFDNTNTNSVLFWLQKATIDWSTNDELIFAIAELTWNVPGKKHIHTHSFC